MLFVFFFNCENRRALGFFHSHTPLASDGWAPTLLPPFTTTNFLDSVCLASYTIDCCQHYKILYNFKQCKMFLKFWDRFQKQNIFETTKRKELIFSRTYRSANIFSILLIILIIFFSPYLETIRFFIIYVK